MVLLRLAVLAILGYLVLVAFLFLMQRRMLYLPEKTEPNPAFIHEQGLDFWPGNTEAFRGFVSTATPEAPHGTVVVFHGNAGAAWHRDYYLEALEPRGFRVLLAEYPGYGGRASEPDEQTLIGDARETVNQALAQFGEPVYLWGESLGSAVAAAVAGDKQIRTAGVVLITPWDSLSRLAQTHYPYVPARWLIRDRFDSVGHLSDYDSPVAVVIATHDRIVPRKHSMRLYNTLGTTKRLWQLDAGHNSWPTAPESRWWQQVGDFLRAVPPP